jgi:hypothetical protein
MDRLRILNLWQADDYFQVRTRQYVVAHFFSHPGGSSAGYLRRLRCRSSDYFGFWQHGHSLGNGTSIDFCPYHQKTHGISFSVAMTTPGGRLRIHNVLTFYHAGLWQCSLYS